MARLIRVECAGATYHVMGRGNQGQAIYASDEARRWVSERLRMGDESRVTQALRRVKAGGDPELRALRPRLERAGENQD